MDSQPSSGANVITYRAYNGEQDLPHVMALVQSELSEPYVIYTFRYFLCQWPHLAFLAFSSQSSNPVGVIVCKQSMHRSTYNRGYIAMLSVDKAFRKRGIASALVRRSMEAMKEDGVDEIVLETEYDNHAALSLYESLGFIREKRLYRFYLNGKDAFRLILSIPPQTPEPSESDEDEGSRSGSTIGEKRQLPRKGQRYRAIRVIPYSDEEDEYSSR
ncbi:acyl-CoA N-acyltransferase, partial [Gymnopus androsaceus JB14]